MSYALNLGADGRVLSATYPQYAPADAVTVEALPEGDISEYLWQEGAFVHSPLPQQPAAATQQDRIEAQLAYTAMMTDTMLPEAGV